MNILNKKLMYKLSSFVAVAIIAAAAAFGLSATNFLGMVLILLLTALFALISGIVDGIASNHFDGKDFASVLSSTMFGICALGGLINGHGSPLWLTIIMITLVFWLKPRKWMLIFAAWMTGCSTIFFVQSCLHKDFVWEVCLTEVCIIAFVVSVIIARFKKENTKQAKV